MYTAKWGSEDAIYRATREAEEKAEARATRRISMLEKEVKQEAFNDQKALRQERSKLIAREGALREKRKKVLDLIKKKKGEFDEAVKERDSLRKEIAQRDKQNKEQETKYVTEVKETKGLFQRAKGKVEDLQRQIQAEVEARKQKEVEIEKVVKERDEIAKEKDEIAKQSEAKQAELRKQEAAVQKTLQETQKKLAATEGEYKKFQERVKAEKEDFQKRESQISGQLAEKQKEVSQLQKGIEQMRSGMERTISSEVQKRAEAIRSEEHQKAQDALARARLQDAADATERIKRLTMPKGAKKTLIIDDDKGISLGASMRNQSESGGALEWNSMSPSDQTTRIDAGVKRLASRRLAEGMKAFAVDFREKIKEINAKEKPENRWQKIQNLMAAQANREAAYENDLVEVRQKYVDFYRGTLMKFQKKARERGGWDLDIADEFDAESEKINKKLLADSSRILSESLKMKTRWDSIGSDLYRRSRSIHLKLSGRRLGR